jgi:hypothetical protein
MTDVLLRTIVERGLLRGCRLDRACEVTDRYSTAGNGGDERQRGAGVTVRG